MLLNKTARTRLENQMGTRYPLIATLPGLNRRLCANPTEVIRGVLSNLLSLANLISEGVIK